MGCFNDPAWKVYGWVGGVLADTNYLCPARRGWIKNVLFCVIQVNSNEQALLGPVHFLLEQSARLTGQSQIFQVSGAEVSANGVGAHTIYACERGHSGH